MTESPLTPNPTQPLSTPDFLARVLALNPGLAVFDCDGTLWSGDAGSSFMRWSMGQIDAPALLPPDRIAWLNDRYHGYQTGRVSELAICGEMVQVYRGLPVAQLRRAAATFFHTHVEPHIFPEMATLVAALQRSGVDIWAVSSTCDWVVEEGVRRFNIPANRVLAASVECSTGGSADPSSKEDELLATDRLRSVPTDEGKVEALRLAGITAPDAVFGNSIHDAAMLAIARQAFPVNPSPELAHLSAARGWPLFYPAAVLPAHPSPPAARNP